MKINFLQDFKPKKLNEIFGQEQLTAEGKILSAMVCIQKPYSLLIYGPTSCGKTSLAIVLCNELKREFLLFNASVDNKNLLTEMVAEAKEKQKILIIDEIHRMNKNVIEYLLPFLDNNEVIVFGLTTESIFYTIPAAIRSRCFSCRLNPITPAIVFMILQYQCTKHKVKIEPTILKKISVRSNGDVRTAIRMLEMMSEYRDATNTTFEQIDTFFPEGLDFTTENATSYYDMLSALHKSCRGSDVNAALYWLARLLLNDDLSSISRRLVCIANEDIGLANEALVTQVMIGSSEALRLGMPEARLIYSNLIIQICLSDKSNSTVVSMDNAIAKVNNGGIFDPPLYIRNTSIESHKYQYPHNFKNHYVDQQYLPDQLKYETFFKFDKSVKNENELVEKWAKRTSKKNKEEKE